MDVESIRKLFAPAIKDKHILHIIVIDEIDSIARSRKFARNEWEITKVNQLLSSLDGLNQLDSALVIATTK